MALKVYAYKNCSTCQKALQFLKSKKIAYQEIPIVDQPPSLQELKQMLKWVENEGGNIKSLLNTSGQQYRELGMSEKLKSGMKSDEVLRLLAANGKLIKRPFLVSDKGGLVGFKADAWEEFISSLL